MRSTQVLLRKSALSVILALVLTMGMCPQLAFASEVGSGIPQSSGFLSYDQATPLNEDITEQEEGVIGEAATSEHSDSLIIGSESSLETAFEPLAVDATIALKVTENYTFTYEVLSLVNQERAKVGQPPLTMDYRLLDAAMQRAAECAVLFSHTRPNGNTWSTAFPTEATGTRGENIAAGQSTPAAVMTSWMNSEGHRDNILSSYTSIGIGCVYHNGAYYWSQLFNTMTATDNSNSGSLEKTRSIEISAAQCNFSSAPATLLLEKTSLEIGNQTKGTMRVPNPGWNYASFVPEAASLTWASSQPSVCSVSSNGIITAIDKGSTVITASIAGTSATASANLIVPANWIRLSGSDRLATMTAIVKEGFATSDTVIIATAANFPDALSASGIAGLNDAPVITTASNTLSDESRQQISRLNATKAIIIGGEAAVAKKVETDLRAMGLSTKRLSGDSREATSVAVLQEGSGLWSDTAIIATGNGFADALSVSSFAYAKEAPIVLAGGNNMLSPEAIDAIKQEGFSTILIVGGTGVVSQEVYSQLAQAGISAVPIRLGGGDRYDTSIRIAQHALLQGMQVDNLGIATGANFPDALAGAAFCGSKNSILLLAADDINTRTQIHDYLYGYRSSINLMYAFGGEAVLSDSLMNYLAS